MTTGEQGKRDRIPETCPRCGGYVSIWSPTDGHLVTVPCSTQTEPPKEQLRLDNIADPERQVAELTETVRRHHETFKASARMERLLTDRIAARDALIERLRERYWRADIACPACGWVVRGSVLEELGYCPHCLRADGQAQAPTEGGPEPA